MSNNSSQTKSTNSQIRLRIAYFPDEDIGNAYSTRMREILSSFGIVEPFKGIKSCIKNRLTGQKNCDLVVINWVDNEVASSIFLNWISITGTIRIYVKALIMRLTVRKVIFIRHNNYPHTLTGNSAILAKWLIDGYEKLFNVVLTHSGAHVTPHRLYCPHPLYKRAHNDDIKDNSELIPCEKYYVSFGRISPYKNLERLMTEFPKEKNLLIIGSIGDQDYVDHLSDIKRPNLIFRPGFLSESSAQRIVMNSDGVVISHADSDVVVSGTFFYAISVKCRVFAVTTPFLEWVKPRIGSDILSLGGDVSEVCQLIDAAKTFDSSAANWDRVEDEFGDESVRSSFANAMALAGTTHG